MFKLTMLKQNSILINCANVDKYLCLAIQYYKICNENPAKILKI